MAEKAGLARAPNGPEARAPGPESRHDRRPVCRATCAALTVMLAGPALGARLDIVPTLTVEETYTDNLRLSPRGTEESDLVTTLTPRLLLRGTGDRLQVDIDYRPQLVYWAKQGDSRVFNSYVASGTAEFIKKTLLLDVRFSESQQNVSLLGPLTDNNINLTDNRTSVRSLLVSPVVRHEFGTDAKAEARFSYSRLSSGASDALSDSESRGVNARIDSGPAYKLLTWNVQYQRERTEYDDSQLASFDTQKIQGGVKRLITPQVALTANGGYEDNTYFTNGPPTKGTLWSVGAEWNPSVRTRLAATVGRRYFGTTKSLDFTHRGRLSAWTLNYSEDVTTTRTQFLVPTTGDTAAYLDALFLSSIPDPIARQAAVNAFISRNGLQPSLSGPVNFFSSIPFVSKRLQGTFGITGVRNTIVASLFSETREALVAPQPGEGDFSVSEKARQTGAAILWSTALSATTSANASVAMTRNEFVGTGRRDTDKSVRFGLTHQFQPKLSGSLFFRRVQNDSAPSGVGYRENSITAVLLAKF